MHIRDEVNGGDKVLLVYNHSWGNSAGYLEQNQISGRFVTLLMAARDPVLDYVFAACQYCRCISEVSLHQRCSWKCSSL